MGAAAFAFAPIGAFLVVAFAAKGFLAGAAALAFDVDAVAGFLF